MSEEKKDNQYLNAFFESKSFEDGNKRIKVDVNLDDLLSCSFLKVNQKTKNKERWVSFYIRENATTGKMYGKKIKPKKHYK